MDFIITRGVKHSSLLLSRNSNFFLQLSSFLSKRSELAAYHHFSILEKCQPRSNQSHNVHRFSNQNCKILESKLSLYPVNFTYYSTSTKADKSSNKKSSLSEDGNKAESDEKPSVFQRMKQLTKDYWHILIPVHIVTSIGWASIFYIAVRNGVDIVGILESLHFSEKYLEMLKNSTAGHWAVTYALYKIFTPLRYTITVGGTTMTIRYLDKMGIMKFKGSKADQLMQSSRAAVKSMSVEKLKLPQKSNQSKSSKF